MTPSSRYTLVINTYYHNNLIEVQCTYNGTHKKILWATRSDYRGFNGQTRLKPLVKVV